MLNRKVYTSKEVFTMTMSDGVIKPQEAAQGSVVKAVRLPGNAVPAFDALVRLHFQLEHIPTATDSAYLQYLITRDAEQMRDDIIKRRSAINR
jgi:hypothetical protein